MFTRRVFLGTGLAGVLPAQTAKRRPNILLISCENLGPHLGCYGDASVATPALDAFAAAAVRFAQAFAVSGVGAVSRSAIQTGMFPSTIGSHFNGRAALPPFIKPFSDYLRVNGYQIDKPKPGSTAPLFVWKRLDAVNASKVRLRGAAYEALIRPVKRRVTGSAQEEAPFPPHLEDSEESRRDWANYHELISLLDRQFAAALKAGVRDDNTLVIFCSEFGFTLREGNSAAYETGTRVPLLIRLPGTAPGSVSQRRVMLLDLAPTILNLAGVAIPTHMQGQAFLGERLSPARRSVFATVDRADMHYETIRSIRSGAYRYVCNYTKGTEELFDSDRDPFEVKNLAATDPATLSRLREQLDRWRADTHDLGLIPEAELAAREAASRTRYAVARQPRFDDLQQRLSKVAMTTDEARLRAAFADEDAAVRAWACLKAPRGLTSDLRKALSDPSGTVRILAATALRKQVRTDNGVLRILVKELTSQEEWLRFAAILAIEELGERDPKATEIMRTAAKADPNRAVAALAARVLKGWEEQSQ